MATKKIITLHKQGNILCVSPTTDTIFEILKPVLSFTEQQKAFGVEAQQRKAKGLGPLKFTEHNLFELDFKQRLVAPFGFWKLIRDTLRKHGYRVGFKDLKPMPARRLQPRWKNIASYQLRTGQPEFLKQFLTNRCGRFDCPPGFGKSYMIGIMAALLPRARFDIVTRRAAVLRDRIYPELVQMVGDVGIVGGGKRVTGCRVMCYTVGSIHHAKGDGDFLVGDECHELASDKAAEELARWQDSRNMGLSASHDMRWDGKDLRTHGLFGPVVFRMSYEEAQSSGLVVPITVHWTPVVMDFNPCGDYADIEKKRHGIWRNEYRNQCIAQDARRYGPDVQTLITVETLEHAMNLKRLLPEYTLVYREGGLTERERNRYAHNGYCKASEPLMDIERREKLTTAFEKGKLKKAICTTVWNVGVSFNHLSVLLRAEGSSSAIASVQVPGRASRIQDGKAGSLVHDYLDQFDHGCNMKAVSRMKIYKQNRWEQVFPGSTTLNDHLR